MLGLGLTSTIVSFLQYYDPDSPLAFLSGSPFLFRAHSDAQLLKQLYMYSFVFFAFLKHLQTVCFSIKTRSPDSDLRLWVARNRPA